MSSRRRLLEIIATSFKWLSQSFVNLYYSLVPTSISGKQVKDKARVKKVYGNSEVENQLAIIPTIATQTVNGVTITNNGDGSVTLSGKATAQTTFDLSGNLSRNIPLGHYVFITNFKTPSQATYYLYDAYESGLVSGLVGSPNGYIKQKAGSSTIISPRIRIENGVTINETVFVMYIDLTQEYPFDTPTTLDDVRVQTILNRGYLPHNTGTIKSVNMSELGSEPYNLFDGSSLSSGRYDYDNGTTVISNTDGMRCVNYQKVVGGFSYLLSTELLPTSNKTFILYEYDEYKNFIKYTSLYSTYSATITISQNTSYLKFSIYSSGSGWGTNPPSSSVAKICFHRTGTRTGYAPHQFNIHLKSLLGKQNSLTKGSTSSSSSVIMMNNQVIYYGWTYGTNKFDITAQAHKYFVYVTFANPISKKFSMFIGINGNNLQSTKYWTNTNAKTEAYAIFDNTNSSISKIENVWLYANGSESYFNSETDYPSQYFLLDLTRYGLQDLTDEQVRALLTPEMINKLCNGETLGTIPFKYQGGGVGTSHDSLEITATEYVFTKNVGVVDLSQLTSTYNPNAQAWQYAVGSLSGIKPPEGWGALANAISDKFLQIDTNHGYNQNVVGYFYINPTGILYVNNGSTTTAPTGTLEYQLATPQVIRIPKKRLGIARIRDFSWVFNSQYNLLEAITSGFNMKTPLSSVVANLYCPCALTIASDNKATTSGARVYIYDVHSTLTFRDMSVSNVNDFLDKYGDYLIFYETAEDVAEIETKINVEAGGTLTSNSEVLPNVDMEIKCK